MAETKTGTPRAVLYGRISQDDRGDAAGVQRQLEDARALADVRGWTVVAALTDNDISAFNGKHRPGYEQLMAMVESGEVDRVIVWHLSRLWRSRSERGPGIDLFKQQRVSISTVRGPELDLGSAYGRGMAGLMGEFDTMESDVKSERVARASEQRAHAGKPNGTVPYGYRRRYVTDEDGRVLDRVDEPHEPEAAIVREIVDRLLAGDTLRGITDDLNNRKVPAPGVGHRRGRRAPDNPDGTRWGKTSVKKLASRPTNVGQRVHRGVVVAEGAWEPIVDRDSHDRVVALLSDPSRVANRGLAQRRHLLTFGVGECGVCGGRLRVAPKGGHQLYVCEPNGCVGRRREWVDDVAERVMVATLQRDDVRSLLGQQQGDTGVLAELAELRGRLADASEAYAAGRLPLEALTHITTALGEQIADAEKRAHVSARPTPRVVRGLLAEGDVVARWNGLDVASKHTVMEALGLRVTILPARGGAGFKPESVVPSWVAS